MSIENIFHRISLNETIPETDKKLISENFLIKKYRKNSLIITEEEDFDRIFFILNGVVRIYYSNSDGNEITRSIILENEFCTNLISFTKQSQNYENLQCLEDTIVFFIQRENFYKILKQSHLLTSIYAKMLEFFINKNLQHFQFMSTLNHRQRIEKFLKDHPEINKRVKDKIIATYLGVTPEFLSRTKKEFYKT